eukprot:6712432-Pyramimonas_sp.AAC.1
MDLASTENCLQMQTPGSASALRAVDAARREEDLSWNSARRRILQRHLDHQGSVDALCLQAGTLGIEEVATPI